MKINILIILLIASLYIVGCKNDSKPSESYDEHEHAEEEHTEASANEVSLTATQMKNIDIQLGKLEQRNLKNIVKANGVLDLPPQNLASVSSYIGGIIRTIYVIQGDYVKKGQKLASLEHPDIIEVQEEYLRAKSSFSLAKKEYQRQKELLEEKIIAAKKFQQAEDEFMQQRALLSSLESRLRLMHISPSNVSHNNIISAISITSPIIGYVNHVDVNTGSLVDPTKEIFEIVDNSHVHVDLQVYENDLSQIKEGQKVYFTLSNYPNQEFMATIFAIGKSFDNKTKSVEVHADFEGNKDKNLMPGMYVNGRIEVGSGTVQAIPNDAIISEGDLKYIFIKSDMESHHNHNHEEENHSHEEPGDKETTVAKFKRVEVKTGVSDMGYTEIISLGEIPVNAQIVTKGAYYLSAQLRKGQGGGGGEHGH